MNCRHLKLAMAVSSLVLCAELSDGQTSELYMLSSPNVEYPVATTSVYQGGHLLRSWTAANPYETSLAVVGGSVRQGAEEYGFVGSDIRWPAFGPELITPPRQTFMTPPRTAARFMGGMWSRPPSDATI